MHACRQLCNVDIRFVPPLGDAGAELKCMTGDRLVGADCRINKIMPLPPIPTHHRPLPLAWDGDTCAAALHTGFITGLSAVHCCGACMQLATWHAAATRSSRCASRRSCEEVVVRPCRACVAVPGEWQPVTCVDVPQQHEPVGVAVHADQVDSGHAVEDRVGLAQVELRSDVHIAQLPACLACPAHEVCAAWQTGVTGGGLMYSRWPARPWFS